MARSEIWVRWQAVIDNATCPRCRPLDGQIVDKRVVFPPLHRWCRCGTEPVDRSELTPAQLELEEAVVGGGPLVPRPDPIWPPLLPPDEPDKPAGGGGAGPGNPPDPRSPTTRIRDGLGARPARGAGRRLRGALG